MRDFKIHVERTALGNGSAYEDSRSVGDTHYIHVDEQDADVLCVSPLIVVAHEIGHALAREFGLPGQRHGIKYLFDRQSRLHSENEAWDVAQLLFEMNRARAFAIGKHMEQFDKPEKLVLDPATLTVHPYPFEKQK